MSRAQVILEAVRLTANNDIAALEQLLSSSRALIPEHILRILLTYLPEGTDPDSYVGLLQLLSQEQYMFEPSAIGSKRGEEDLEDEARGKIRRLRLVPLIMPNHPLDEGTDLLSLFLIHQAHKIDADTGSLQLVVRLMEPFVWHSEVLNIWMISILLPLLRFEYDYYPHTGTPLSLEEFENMGARETLQAMLSRAVEKHTPGEKIKTRRDLRGLVGPWMYGETKRKRRKVDFGRVITTSMASIEDPDRDENGDERPKESDWSYVNEWLLDLGLRDFPKAVDAVAQWDGPEDVDYGEWRKATLPMNNEGVPEAKFRYAQTGVAITYATNEASIETIIASHRVMLHVIRLMNLDEPLDLKRSDAPLRGCDLNGYIDSLSPSSLLHDRLLDPHNCLTQATGQSMIFLNIILASCYKLLKLGCSRSARAVVRLVLFATESEQRVELRRALYQLTNEKLDGSVWSSVRRQILWLRDWQPLSEQSNIKPQGIFSKLERTNLENELLRAMVDAECYDIAVDIYCKEGTPLPVEQVEDTVLTAALSAYDAASNGNKTRGGARKASDIISTFQSYFQRSQRFPQINALLSATHAMSFYSLILQHGVPFQPVNIRAHKDPMSLIGKILEQNPRSYTHLGDLLDIGQSLVTAGLGQQSHDSGSISLSKETQEYERIDARRRIIRMAIEASLAENDFDTAYSYVVNRLPMSQTPEAKSDQSPALYDDISWRAAYAAGRYPTSNSGSSAIRRLEQRMEVLSQALLLAPPSALSDLLVVWQQCEKQMTDLAESEAAEEKRLEEKADHAVPGGFTGDPDLPREKPRDSTRNAIQEEAPMGLFDVARGAAAALSKNAFPLGGGQRASAPASKTTQSRPLSVSSLGDLSDDSTARVEGVGRVRKRDMVLLQSGKNDHDLKLGLSL
ncbi:MAG: hypothetical protein Q9164_000601 [Protoblastenia rupestris]